MTDAYLGIAHKAADRVIAAAATAIQVAQVSFPWSSKAWLENRIVALVVAVTIVKTNEEELRNV